MLRKLTLIAALAVAGGCYASVGDTYPYGYYSLDYVQPGVAVVTNYDYPVFYSRNYYWRYDTGRWYRSNHYYAGWVHAQPPYPVAHIHNPGGYVHYRPTYYAHGRVYRHY